jgi:hypothetical protein
MTMYYSASKRGFYDPEFHTTIPADAVEISAERHRELLEEQSAGWMISHDSEGNPIVVEHPEPTPAEEMAYLRHRRDELLRASDFSQFADAPLDGEQRSAWSAYRQQLRDLPATFASTPADTVWPTPPARART